jgi:hypothetical protein
MLYVDDLAQHGIVRLRAACAHDLQGIVAKLSSRANTPDETQRTGREGLPTVRKCRVARTGGASRSSDVPEIALTPLRADAHQIHSPQEHP